jgi:flagellar hook-associated protein 3 FlgL
MSTSIRSGSANTYDASLRNILLRQADLATLQNKLTSGKKIVQASDDPTGAANAERAMTRIGRIATDQRALASQRDSIASAESTLGDVTTALQNFRELVVSAGNGVNSAPDRKTIALQLQGLRDQIFSMANQKDTNGQPLFSALGSALAPFVGPQATTPDYTFNGLPGTTGSSPVSIPYALDGNAAFMLTPSSDTSYNITNSNPATQLTTSTATRTAPSAVIGASYTISNMSVSPSTVNPGNSTLTYSVTTTPADGSAPSISLPITSNEYLTASNTVPITVDGLSLTLSGTPSATDTISITPNASIFSVLDNAIKDIGSASSNTTAAQAVSQALGNIDIGMARVSAVRGKAGDLLNRADSNSSNQDQRTVQLKSDQSNAEDIDMVSAISEFQSKQTGYSAALQSYAQVQKLSLFNFIG